MSGMVLNHKWGRRARSASGSVYPHATPPNAIPVASAASKSRISSPIAIAEEGARPARFTIRLNFAVLPKRDAPQAKSEKHSAVSPSWSRALASLSELTSRDPDAAATQRFEHFGDTREDRDFGQIFAFQPAHMRRYTRDLPQRKLEVLQESRGRHSGAGSRCRRSRPA